MAAVPGGYGDRHGPWHALAAGRPALARTVVGLRTRFVRTRLLDEGAFRRCWGQRAALEDWVSLWAVLSPGGRLLEAHEAAWPSLEAADPAWLGLAGALLAAGSYADCARLLARLPADGGRVSRMRATLAEQLGHYEEAAAAYAVVAAGPEAREAFEGAVGEANALISLGRLPVAAARVEALETAATVLGPEGRCAWLEVAWRLASHLGQASGRAWAEERLALTRTLRGEQHPAFASAQASLGEALGDLGLPRRGAPAAGLASDPARDLRPASPPDPVCLPDDGGRPRGRRTLGRGVGPLLRPAAPVCRDHRTEPGPAWSVVPGVHGVTLDADETLDGRHIQGGTVDDLRGP
jgi:hypothetical protein